MLGARSLARVVMGLVALCGFALSTPEASAQTLPALPPPPAPPSSVRTLAAHLAAGLYPTRLADGARLAVVVTVKDAAARKELVALLADGLEAELRARTPLFLRVEDGELASERVEIELALKDGHVQATARRRALPQTLWEALGAASGRVLGTAYANAPIDIELRALLGLGRREVRLDNLRVVPVGRKSVGLGRILDCVVVDLDADRQNELVLLEPEGVRALRWADGGFSVERSASALEGPANAAKLRDPLGRLLVVTRADGAKVLVAASSERAEPVALTLGASGFSRADLSFQKGWPLYATGVDSFLIAPWPAGLDSLEGGLTEARFGTSAATWIGPVSKIHALTGEVVAGQLGVLAARVGGGLSQVILSEAATRSAQARGERLKVTGLVPEVGVAAVVTDLDADGRLELMTSSLVLAGPDRLALSPLVPGRQGAQEVAPRPHWAGLAPAPVTAMCPGDVDRDGFEEVIAATFTGRDADLLVVVPR